MPSLISRGDDSFLHDFSVDLDDEVPVAERMTSAFEGEGGLPVGGHGKSADQAGGSTLRLRRKRMQLQDVFAAFEIDKFARGALEFGGYHFPIGLPEADAFPVNASGGVWTVVALFGRNGGRCPGEFGHRSGQCGFLFRGQRPFFGRRQQVPDEVTHHFIRQFPEPRRHQADAGVLQGLDLIPGHDFLAGANAQHAHARRRVFGHSSTQSATVLGGNDDVLISVANDLVGIDDVIE